jgi:hypothetical protein
LPKLKKRARLVPLNFLRFLESKEAEQSAQASSVTPASPVIAPTVINSINYDDAESEARKRNIEYGKDLLSSLEDLRDQILIGNISHNSLLNIEQRLDNLPINSQDEKLLNIVEEIRTRAAVEAEKLKKQFNKN